MLLNNTPPGLLKENLLDAVLAEETGTEEVPVSRLLGETRARVALFETAD